MSNQFHEEGHLGGCMIGGDPATYYPKMWKFIIDQLKISSVFDLGCGEGHSLQCFKNYNCEALGVDGCQAAVDTSSIKEQIVLHDFSKDVYHPNRSFDMVWCCEFVEHVDAQYKNNFLQTIQETDAKYVFMTHATPNQGGYHHVNCQGSSYWIALMAEYGYELATSLTRMMRSAAHFEFNAPCNHFARSGLVFVKKCQAIQKVGPQTAVITWASGKEFCQLDTLKVFVESLNKIAYAGDKIVFTHDMEIESREYFEKNGFCIIDVDPNRIEWVVRDRFLIWHEFLSYNNYYRVYLVDSKDVVFQAHPDQISEGISSFADGITFVGEGKKHQECDWNTKDQQRLKEHLKQDYNFKNWEVICGGTIFGPSKDLQYFCLQIYLMTKICHCSTDQAVLNYLYHHFYKKSPHKLADPRLSNLVRTADLPAGTQSEIKNCAALFSKNQPYLIWHQWDRVPEVRDTIIQKYLNNE